MVYALWIVFANNNNHITHTKYFLTVLRFSFTHLGSNYHYQTSYGS